MPVIISLDGNIGAGKTTLLEAISAPDIHVVKEPVGEWLTMRDSDGRSLLELFYADKKRWAYTFQNCAVLSRVQQTHREIAAATAAGKRIILMERSVLTDRYVFAEMLREMGDITALEWTLYNRWFESYAANLPIRGLVYLQADVPTAQNRIQKRGREGEGSITADYLSALGAAHDKLLSAAEAAEMPILKLSAAAPIQTNADLLTTFVRKMASTQ